MMIRLCFLLLLNYYFLLQTTLAYEIVSRDADGTKHINIPFITHIAVKKHADGTKDVDVKAPFVKVHNPAGPDNAQVKAPFYKTNPSSTTAGTTTTPNNVAQPSGQKQSK